MNNYYQKMKPYLLNQKKLVYVLLFFHLNGLHPQENSRASMNVVITANVVSDLEIITISDIDVGPVQPSQIEVNLDPGQDPGVGLIKINGTPDASLQIVYTKQVIMTGPGNSTLTVNYSVNGYDINEQSSSVPFEESTITVQMNSAGEYYVWIGCQFYLSEVVSGQYDGDFVLEVDYD